MISKNQWKRRKICKTKYIIGTPKLTPSYDGSGAKMDISHEFSRLQKRGNSKCNKKVMV